MLRAVLRIATLALLGLFATPHTALSTPSAETNPSELLFAGVGWVLFFGGIGIALAPMLLKSKGEAAVALAVARRRGFFRGLGIWAAVAVGVSLGLNFLVPPRTAAEAEARGSNLVGLVFAAAAMGGGLGLLRASKMQSGATRGNGVSDEKEMLRRKLAALDAQQERARPAAEDPELVALRKKVAAAEARAAGGGQRQTPPARSSRAGRNDDLD